MFLCFECGLMLCPRSLCVFSSALLMLSVGFDGDPIWSAIKKAEKLFYKKKTSKLHTLRKCPSLLLFLTTSILTGSVNRDITHDISCEAKCLREVSNVSHSIFVMFWVNSTLHFGVIPSVNALHALWHLMYEIFGSDVCDLGCTTSFSLPVLFCGHSPWCLVLLFALFAATPVVNWLPALIGSPTSLSLWELLLQLCNLFCEFWSDNHNFWPSFLVMLNRHR